MLRVLTSFFYADKSICSFDPLRIASDCQTNLKFFTWLEHLIKIHLEYYKKYVRGLFYNFTRRGVLFKYKCAKQKMTCQPNLFKIKINDITESVNILLQCQLQFFLKEKICFSVGITLSNNLLGMATIGCIKIALS